MSSPISTDQNDLIKKLLECHNVFVILFWRKPAGMS